MTFKPGATIFDVPPAAGLVEGVDPKDVAPNRARAEVRASDLTDPT